MMDTHEGGYWYERSYESDSDGSIESFEPKQPTEEERSDLKKGTWMVLKARLEVSGEMEFTFEDVDGLPKLNLCHSQTMDRRRMLRLRVPIPTLPQEGEENEGEAVKQKDQYAALDLIGESAADDPGARVSHEDDPFNPNNIIIQVSFAHAPVRVPSGIRVRPANSAYEFFDRLKIGVDRGARIRLQLTCVRKPGLLYSLKYFSSYAATTQNAPPVKEYYSSHRQFRVIWSTAATLDYEALKNAWSGVTLRDLPGKCIPIRNDCNLYRIVLGHPAKPIQQQKIRMLKLQEGAMFRIIWPSVRARMRGEKLKGDIKGRISKLDEEMIHKSYSSEVFLAMSVNIPQHLKDSFERCASFDIEPSFDKSQLKRQKATARAVHRLQRYPGDPAKPQQGLVETILFGTETKSVNRSSHVRAAQLRCLEDAGLNQKQIEASISALGRMFTMIQGPPGTGKSRTAIQTLAAHFLGNFGLEHPGAVLCCAPSNVATDNLLRQWTVLASRDDNLRRLKFVRFTSDHLLHLELRRKKRRERNKIKTQGKGPSAQPTCEFEEGNPWTRVHNTGCGGNSSHEVRLVEPNDISDRRTEVLKEIERTWIKGSVCTKEQLYMIKYGAVHAIAAMSEVRTAEGERVRKEPEEGKLHVEDSCLPELFGSSSELKGVEYYTDLFDRIKHRYSAQVVRVRDKQARGEDDEGDEDDEDDESDTEKLLGIADIGYPYEFSLAAKIYDADPSWLDQVMDYLSGDMTRDEMRIFHTIRDNIRCEVMKEMDLVFGTCFGLGDRSIRKASPKLTIVDEAGQCSEIETLIPIVVPSIQQVILYGDHQQLPPINVFNNKIFTQSLLERLAMLRTAQTPGADFHTLEENYRSVPGIVEFFSKHWYNNCLQPKASLEPIEGLSKLCKSYPIAWLSTTGNEEDSETGSKLNRHNAAAVLKLVKFMVGKGLCISRVAVIAMYSSQVALIQGMLFQEDLGEIRVGTVDSFQGSERDVIILDLVRANSLVKHDVGFLRETRRINVAVSRARLQLIVVGNKQFYSSSPIFNFNKDRIDSLYDLRRFPSI